MKKKTSKTETVTAKVSSDTKAKLAKKAKKLKTTKSKVAADLLEKNL